MSLTLRRKLTDRSQIRYRVLPPLFHTNMKIVQYARCRKLHWTTSKHALLVYIGGGRLVCHNLPLGTYTRTKLGAIPSLLQAVERSLRRSQSRCWEADRQVDHSHVLSVSPRYNLGHRHSRSKVSWDQAEFRRKWLESPRSYSTRWSARQTGMSEECWKQLWRQSRRSQNDLSGIRGETVVL